jgi:hypothetical protein
MSTTRARDREDERERLRAKQKLDQINRPGERTGEKAN